MCVGRPVNAETIARVSDLCLVSRDQGVKKCGWYEKSVRVVGRMTSSVQRADDANGNGPKPVLLFKTLAKGQSEG